MNGAYNMLFFYRAQCIKYSIGTVSDCCMVHVLWWFYDYHFLKKNYNISFLPFDDFGLSSDRKGLCMKCMLLTATLFICLMKGVFSVYFLKIMMMYAWFSINSLFFVSTVIVDDVDATAVSANVTSLLLLYRLILLVFLQLLLSIPIIYQLVLTKPVTQLKFNQLQKNWVQSNQYAHAPFVAQFKWCHQKWLWRKIICQLIFEAWHSGLEQR